MGKKKKPAGGRSADVPSPAEIRRAEEDAPRVAGDSVVEVWQAQEEAPGVLGEVAEMPQAEEASLPALATYGG